MLTRECVNCPFWRDTATESGCAYPRPIDECKAFDKEYNERTVKKYYGFETTSKSGRDMLRGFLKDNEIYYELSMCFGAYHFEILADHFDVQLINSFLDKEIICHEELTERTV